MNSIFIFVIFRNITNWYIIMLYGKLQCIPKRCFQIHFYMFRSSFSQIRPVCGSFKNGCLCIILPLPPHKPQLAVHAGTLHMLLVIRLTHLRCVPARDQSAMHLRKCVCWGAGTHLCGFIGSRHYRRTTAMWRAYIETTFERTRQVNYAWRDRGHCTTATHQRSPITSTYNIWMHVLICATACI